MKRLYLSPISLFISFTLYTSILSACNASFRQPPTPTPIPAYVTGEEDLAYSAFIEYYAQYCWRSMEYRDGRMVIETIDTSQPGRAIYIGDGIWRFRVMIKHKLVEREADSPFPPEPRAITVRSLADGGWEDACPVAGARRELTTTPTTPIATEDVLGSGWWQDFWGRDTDDEGIE